MVSVPIETFHTLRNAFPRNCGAGTVHVLLGQIHEDGSDLEGSKTCNRRFVRCSANAMDIDRENRAEPYVVTGDKSHPNGVD
jgi:hypothetical protein